MAISRPLLLALLGAVLLGATFFAVQNARDNSSDEAAPAASQPAEGTAQGAQPARASNPEDTVRAALSDGLKSASFEGELSASGAGQSGTLEVSGAFETPAKGEVAEFELHVKAQGVGSDVDAGFISTGDEGFIVSGDEAYRVPASAWKQVVDAAAKAETPAEQVELPFTFNLSNWLRDVEQADGETLDGVETTHVSASLDVGAMLTDVMAAAQQAGTPAAALPPELQQQATEAVKRADFDLYVGKDDELLRRAQADVEIAPAEGDALEMSAEFSLTAVNEPQDIKAPKNVSPGAPDGAAGSLAQAFLGAVGAEVAAEAPSLAALATNNPQKAARAVQANKKVVIFFRNPRGLDDQAVSKAVRAVDSDTKAVVLIDHVDAVERYGKLVEDLGVSQAPSIVIIDRTGDARLIEGYVDTASLTQAGRGRAMSEQAGGPALRAVPAGPVAARG